MALHTASNLELINSKHFEITRCILSDILIWPNGYKIEENGPLQSPRKYRQDCMQVIKHSKTGKIF